MERAIPLLNEGFNPVLIIAGKDVFLTADFLVSDYLADHRSVNSSVLVIPIGRELTSYLGVSESIPNRPTIRPSSTVVDSRDEDEVQLTFWSVDTWGFEISDGPKPKQTSSWEKAQN